MIEKTRHTKSAQESSLSADAQKAHDLRYGEKAYCRNCKHAFLSAVTLKDSVLLCHALPPQVSAQPVVSPDMSGIANVMVSSHFIPRVVPAEYFCSLFTLASHLTDS